MPANLPGSRSYTLNSGDTIPPGLLDEMQDMIVGAKRGLYKRRIFPSFWRLDTGGATATLVANPDATTVLAEPVWKFSGGGSWRTTVNYEVGEQVMGFTIDAYGDGAVDWSGAVHYASDMASHNLVSIAADSLSNEPVGWTKHTIPMLVSPGPIMGDNGKLAFQIQESGGDLCIGYLTLLILKP